MTTGEKTVELGKDSGILCSLCPRGQPHKAVILIIRANPDGTESRWAYCEKCKDVRIHKDISIPTGWAIEQYRTVLKLERHLEREKDKLSTMMMAIPKDELPEYHRLTVHIDKEYERKDMEELDREQKKGR